MMDYLKKKHPVTKIIRAILEALRGTSLQFEESLNRGVIVTFSSPNSKKVR